MSVQVDASSPLNKGNASKSDFVGVYGTYENDGFVDTEDKGCSNGNKINEEDENKETEKVKEELPPVGFFTLFRYASACDKLLMFVGVIIAIASGASMPAVMVIFGQVISKLIIFDSVSRNFSDVNITTEEFLSETGNLCMWNAAFGGVFLICNYLMVTCFSVAGANQAFRIRCLFMSSVLKQDISWYDTNETGDFASRITGDLTKIQDGIGDKVSLCLSFISSTILCVGVGLYVGWKLALVILSITPVLTIAMAVVTKIQATVTSQEMEAYGTAGSVAEEVFSSIRTVLAFGGEKKEISRYEKCLTPARKKGIKRGILTAVGGALTWFCVFAGYALAFWYGVKLIRESMNDPVPEYDGGKLIIVFFTVMSGSMFIGQCAPYFEAFSQARGAAAKVFSIIDRVPSIDSSSPLGHKPTGIAGDISLSNLCFSYPSRPTVPILRNMSLNVFPGETVALVGPSGCGKSTIVQLILRFYDVESGSVKIDGYDVKELNVGWMRDNIGLVGQEPVLFSTTIAENIRYGKRDATDKEIEDAAKVANVHDFIQALPLKYQTLVGERGTQLSGGQKQRIAIARALIKNPKILLLDEATSALDTESEAVVQAALDKARQGRTTIIIAHRLSTIKTADKIVVLKDGEVQETGTHDELMIAKGIYYDLVSTQTKAEVKDVDDDDAEDPEEDLPDLERRISVLSAGSLNSGDVLPGALGQRPSTGRQISSGGYRRQSSVLSGLERQTSVNSAEKYFPEMKTDEEEEAKENLSQSRLLKLSAPEWPYILVGCISSILMGIHFPVFGVVFGDILGVLSGDPEKIDEETAFFCLFFVLMAITSGLFTFLQIFMFSLVGEKLTSRLRKEVFANIISQDIAFFDNPKNSVGSLCSRLTSDASGVQGATGSKISTILQAISTFVASIAIALYLNYKIGSVVLAFIPLVLLGTYLEAKVVSGHATREKTGMEDGSKIAIEAIEAVRTVASLHQEETFYNQFHDSLLGPHKKSRTKSHVRGLCYGFAQAMPAMAYALSLYYGSILVANKELKYADLLKILEGVLFGVFTVGQAIAFAPDYQNAKVSAVRIFKLLDTKPTIDAFSKDGKTMAKVNGHVGFSKVYFNYPSRPNVRILQNLSLEIEPGKTIALVGSSGCGKSTCVQLIERFYDTQYGTVQIDEEVVKDMNVSNLRSHAGLVSQEPILFSYSIAENIAYGDNSRDVDMNEIIAAARQANIHNFITTLPQGYATPVGDKGAQLSGGQKQRVAIARALLRNPKILLLDEATSALDAESEKVVQEALDHARTGRTCLIIAHRLTTIQNADLILVIHKGRIVEKGKHQELLNKKGHYYKLHNTQAGTM